MAAPRSDKVFDGSIPEFYDTYLTPLIFEPYAEDLAQGTPLRSEIEERDASLLAHATDVATTAVAERFGINAVDGKIQAHVISVRASDQV